MKVVKRDIDAVENAIDLYETNIGGGDENPCNHRILSDLKKLLVKMYKSALKT